MRNPYRKRRIDSPPKFYHFKPAGIPSRALNSIILSVDEFEAIRLADFNNLDHQEASELMNISRPTFTRLIEKARQKVAKVLIEGSELIVEGGNIEFVNNIYQCRRCGNIKKKPMHDQITKCPKCDSDELDSFATRHLKNDSDWRQESMICLT